MPALPKPVLCLVTSGPIASGIELADVVDAAIGGGANLIQLRAKDRPAGEVYELALRLREICGGRALLVINDRLDVALAVHADGVQLGERSLSVDAARLVCGSKLLVGRSVHSVEGAIAAKGADFLVVGTIFASASHPGEPPAGVELISRVTKAVELPVIGIGGIDAANAPQVMNAGAAGIAVIRAILGAKDPGRAAATLRSAIGVTSAQ